MKRLLALQIPVLLLTAWIVFGIQRKEKAKSPPFSIEFEPAHDSWHPSLILATPANFLMTPDSPPYRFKPIPRPIRRFVIEFDIQAGRPTGQWRRIFQRGRKEMERLPLIALYPNDNRLHLRLSTDRNDNDGQDPAHLLPEDLWTKVRWEYYSDGNTRLFFDGHPEVWQTEGLPVETILGKLHSSEQPIEMQLLPCPGVSLRNFHMAYD